MKKSRFTVAHRRQVSLKRQFLVTILSLFCFFPPPAYSSSLEDRLLDVLQKNGLESSKHSIEIVSIPDGEILFQKNPDLPLNPASNIKLVTMATALRELGPLYTFPLEFYSEHLPDKEGRIHNLWIKGYGDPSFITEELSDLVQRFKAMGLRGIDGSIFVDDSYFDRNNLITYLSDTNEKLYRVITGPLSFNFNTIVIAARPGRITGERPVITIEPPTRYVTLENEARTTVNGGNAQLEAEFKMKKSPSSVVRIRGTIPKTIREFNFRQGVPDPAVYTTTVLMEALEKDGIEIRGSIRREAVPRNANLILSHSSRPLREMLSALGKFSNNFTAEQLVKAIAAKRFGPPGATTKGLKALRDYLDSLGIARRDFTLDNGSGLTRLSRLSASSFIKILFDLYTSPWRDDVIASLASAGQDGTLSHKLTDHLLRGRVFAKTGTLNGVSALSGFLLFGNKQIAFSFLFNDFNVSLATIAAAEEKILEIVLNSP